MSFTDFLAAHMLTCPLKALLHMECPGCGMQRSFILLLKGQVTESLQMHPATIPMLSLIVFTCLHLVFKFSKGAKIIIILQCSVAILTMAFYIYKVTQHKIFI